MSEHLSFKHIAEIEALAGRVAKDERYDVAGELACGVLALVEEMKRREMGRKEQEEEKSQLVCAPDPRPGYLTTSIAALSKAVARLSQACGVPVGGEPPFVVDKDTPEAIAWVIEQTAILSAFAVKIHQCAGVVTRLRSQLGDDRGKS